MKNEVKNAKQSRRFFLGAVASTAAIQVAMAGLTPLQALSEGLEVPPGNDLGNAAAWFDGIKGTHRVVFDVPHPNELFPFAWPRVFLVSNGATGAPESECGVMVVLRHSSIGYALDHEMWSKYKLGEVFNAMDPATHKPATRNPFQSPAEGEYKFPAIGPVKIGINELQASGVMFCVCDAAMSVYSTVVAGNLKLEPAAVKQEWASHILPGIQPVPSGVWALGRAQQKGCAYIFAG